MPPNKALQMDPHVSRLVRPVTPKIFVYSLYYDRWSNKLLSTVYINMYIIQLARLFERHWTECGVVCFLSIKYKNVMVLIRLIESITGQLIDYQNNR